jgi:phosphoribosyl-ATP pyrophosphohydrolase/phosphoribosyl-AMP cyclohydrolase
MPHDRSPAENIVPAGARFTPEGLDFAKGDGLLPVVVQDARNLRVLMLGYMDRAALDATLACGQVTFFSRSRQRLWRKGEGSGHVLEVVSIERDCDADTLLVQAIPRGPICHLGRPSCFPDAPAAELAELDARIGQRWNERPAGSYTTQLFDAGVRRIAQKVGEEGVETALAAVAEDDAALLGEAADLAYHLLVLLRSRGLGLRELELALRSRAAG